MLPPAALISMSIVLYVFRIVSRAAARASASNTSFGRFGVPDELIGTLLWLCSDASAFVTGVNVLVDGGFNVYCGV